MLSFFPLYVLDEIWDLIESVSEGFLTYSLVVTNVQILRPDCDLELSAYNMVLALDILFCYEN